MFCVLPIENGCDNKHNIHIFFLSVRILQIKNYENRSLREFNLSLDWYFSQMQIPHLNDSNSKENFDNLDEWILFNTCKFISQNLLAFSTIYKPYSALALGLKKYWPNHWPN